MIRIASTVAATLVVVSSLAGQELAGRNPLSRELPEWLELRAEWRLRAESRTGETLTAGLDDDFGLSRFRIGLTGRPTQHVRFYVEGQDSRLGWREPDRTMSDTEDPFDLRQGWVEIGPESDGPVRLRLGRQMIRLGGERLFGERRWSNISPTWDAARLTLGRDRNRLDVLSMAMVDPDFGWNRPYPESGSGNVHGAYGSLGSLIPKASVEPYLFFVSRPLNGPEQDFGPDAGAWSGGLRVAGELDAGWRYEAEWTGQRGRARERELRGAMAAAQLSYGSPEWPWQTRIHAEHEYASGDPEPGDGRISTYDSLFTARRLHLGLNNILGRRNIRAWETGFETRPAGKVRLRMEFHSFWVASRRDAIYNPDGTVAVAAPGGGAASSRAGDEIDFTLLWAPARYWELDAGAMRFFSRDFVRESRGEAVNATLLYLAMTLRL